MPEIRPSADYRYFDGGKPVLLTEDKLLLLINKSYEDIAQGRTQSVPEGMANLRRRLNGIYGI